MERGEVRYARAGDHHIAYREFVGDAGGDHEIVMVSGANFPMDSLLDDPVAHRLLEGLAGLGRLITFDRRGIALSDPITDWETPLREQWADDLASVIRASGCDRPTVFNWGAAAVAQTCSIRHPEGIGRLVLFNPTAPLTDADAEWMAALADGFARLMAGEQEDDPANPGRADDDAFRAWSDDAGRAGASPRSAERMVTKGFADPPIDNTAITTPTLVISRSSPDWVVPSEFFRRAADQIPGARLVDLGSGDVMPFGADVDELLVEIFGFVTGDARLPAPERHLAAILFTDLVDSTSLAAEAGDARWRRVLDRHDDATRREVARGGGEVVKMTGDGVLALLPSVTAAIEAAQRLRGRLAEDDLEVRIGLHVGEVDRRGDDISGIAVNIAARVMAFAGSGQILTTEVARTIANDVDVTDTGERTLQGIHGTWRLYAVEESDPQRA